MFGQRAEKQWIWDLLVLALALFVAIGSARHYAGSWNDGSRLATVEALVDEQTLMIDHSIFVEVPDPAAATTAPPYPPEDPILRRGTADKLLIDGHYYSDKSPVPALLLAVLYQGLQWTTGLTARDYPDRFCEAMTLGSSGLAYVVAVWSVFRLGRRVGLSLSNSLGLTASLALATVALPYSRHVNNHSMLLGVVAALMLGLSCLATGSTQVRTPWLLLFLLGSLTGLGYSIDLGVAPALLGCTSILVAFRCRGLRPVAVFMAGVFPWFALHHGVNYWVGGTFKPANATPEYFNWPGCPFNIQNMTGGWNHPTLGHFFTYAAALLFGKRGFIGHNMPLYLLALGVVVLWRRKVYEWPEVLFSGCFCGGTWLLYSMASNNYSGQCCSVRWFVPLLAPAYFVLALLLRESPRYRADFLILSGLGALQAALMWGHGPWMKNMIPGYWFWQATGLLAWLLYSMRRRRVKVREESEHNTSWTPSSQAA